MNQKLSWFWGESLTLTAPPRSGGGCVSRYSVACSMVLVFRRASMACSLEKPMSISWNIRWKIRRKRGKRRTKQSWLEKTQSKTLVTKNEEIFSHFIRFQDKPRNLRSYFFFNKSTPNCHTMVQLRHWGSLLSTSSLSLNALFPFS